MARRDVRNISQEIMIPQVVLIVMVLGLTLFGCVMVYSASAPSAISESSDPASYLFDQIKFVVIGIVAAVVLWKVIRYEWWSAIVWIAWVLGVALLLLTAVMGITALGAQRWLILGPISLQPSEFFKISAILMTAKIFRDLRAGALDGATFWLQIVLLVVAPIILLYSTQSDLGTTVVIFVGIVAVMWLGDVPLKYIVLFLAAAVVLGVCAIAFTSYRTSRLVFLDPWNDGANGYGDGYQIIHSYYAFAEGGIFGVGLGNSSEKYLYLPESETDFIFSIIGEELGLIGALAVIIAFLVILWAGMHIARAAFDDFGAMIVGGLVVMLVFQAFLNIACAIGVFPTTGKPLPFISSGGSSMIASYMMVGIILNIASESGAPTVYERRRENLRVIRATSPAQSATAGAPAASASRSRRSSRGSSTRTSRR